MNIKTPNLTVDIVPVCIIDDKPHIILIERKNPPHRWALPGGFVDIGETLLHAAIRELKEETNCKPFFIEFWKMYDEPTRDPRGHNVSAAFAAVIDLHDNTPKAQDDAKNLQIYDIDNLPELAFDHKKIINDVITLIPNLGERKE